MPMTVSTTTGGTAYTSPFVGPVTHAINKKIDLSTLTVDEVDSDGYLKPGVPIRDNGGLGTLITGAQVLEGVTVEAVKLPITLPRDNTTLAAETGDCFVAIATHGVINRDIAEDNLGRAYNANELTAFAAAGSHFRLTTT